MGSQQACIRTPIPTSSPSLAELQRLVLEVLVHEQSKQLLLPLIHSPLFKIDVYQNSIEAIHIKALRSTYPVCHKLVADDFFNTLARVYIKQHPSQTRNLYDYGESFAAFIAEFVPAKSLRYLPCVARLEWACLKAFLGYDCQIFDTQAFSSISEDLFPQIIFHLPKNSSLISSDYPIDRIWEANQEQSAQNETIDLNEGNAKLFVWRRDQKVHIEKLTELQWNWLWLMSQQTSLADMCKQLAHSDANFDILQQIMQNAWVDSFSIKKVSN